MKIKLNWINRNAVTDGTRIYRSEASFDKDSLPPILTTLPHGIEEYVDEDVTKNKRYYYMFEAFASTSSSWSDLKVVLSNSDFGGGSQEFISGDVDRGFMGELTQEEFVGYQTVLNTLNIPNAISTNNGLAAAKWLKYAFNGKICFTPTTFIHNLLTWNDLYDKGAVYGDDTNGPLTTPVPVKQDLRIVIEGKTYRIRLMRAFKDILIPVVKDATWYALPDVEWDEKLLILPNLHPGLVPSQVGFKMGGPGINNVNPDFNLNMHSVVGREDSYVGVDYLTSRIIGSPKTTANRYWFPVLELVHSF